MNEKLKVGDIVWHLNPTKASGTWGRITQVSGVHVAVWQPERYEVSRVHGDVIPAGVSFAGVYPCVLVKGWRRIYVHVQ